MEERASDVGLPASISGLSDLADDDRNDALRGEALISSPDEVDKYGETDRSYFNVASAVMSGSEKSKGLATRVTHFFGVEIMSPRPGLPVFTLLAASHVKRLDS